MVVRRPRVRRRLRAQPLIHLVPHIFTVASLCLGFSAIRYALDARFELAVTLIVLAGVFDGLDGRSARLLKITSRLGAQLDSLADFLSFGVAPALLIYLWSLNQVEGIGWTLALLFATCCALRLARFNTELEDPAQPAWRSRFFTGIPAPAAAGCAIIPMMLSFALQAPWPRAWPLNALVMVFVALMMVSRVPTFSLKMIALRIQPEWVLPTLIFVGMFIAALSNAPWLTLAVVGLAYLASLPIGMVVAHRLRLRHDKEAAEAGRAAAAAASDRVVSLAEPKGRGRPAQPPQR